MSTALLDDLRVLELGTGAAVAQCGRLLTDCGASVEKHVLSGDPVETDGLSVKNGEGSVSLLSIDLNAGKRMRPAETASGIEDATALAKGFDIVILGEPLARQAKAFFEALGGETGGVIVVAMTPYGLSGPKSSYKGSDITSLAAGGFLHMVGDRGAMPLRLGGCQADRSLGATGFTGAMAALIQRQSTGEGALIDAAANETVAYMEWKADIYAQADGKPRTRGEPSQWFDLNCANGPFCFIYENPDWPKIKALVADPDLENPDYQTRDGRLKHHAEVQAILQRWIGGMTKVEAYHKVQQAGIPVGMVADMEDLAQSEHYREAGFLVEIEDPRLGKVRKPGPAWTIDGVRPDFSRASNDQ